MFWEILIAIMLGVYSGTLTGLTPGIHVNLVSLILLSLAPVLPVTYALSLVAFILSLSVTHTFVDSIPSIFLGAPDAAMVLGVLPGHRFLLEGKGYTAVKLTVIGSFLSLVCSILLMPILVYVVPLLYALLRPIVGYLIVAMLCFMILRDKKKLWSASMVCVSGVLGYIVLNTPNVKDPLFPMLSGLYGISTLLFSLKENSSIPKQLSHQSLTVSKKDVGTAISASTFAGFLTSMLPGMGGAQGAVIAMQLARNLGTEGFMILMGGINTVNFVLSTVTLYTLDKARNGAIIAVRELLSKTTVYHLIAYGSIMLVVGSIAVFITLYLARIFASLIVKVNYQYLVIGIILFIVLLVVLLCGWYGCLVLLVATALGLLAPLVGFGRTHAMGCLLIPVAMYFL